MLSPDALNTLQQNLQTQNTLCELMQHMYNLADSLDGFPKETLKETMPSLEKVQVWLQKNATELLAKE